MWFIFVLFASIFEAARFAFSKKLLQQFNGAKMLWMLFLLATPMALLLFWWTSSTLPLSNPQFVLVGILANVSAVAGELLMLAAIKKSDLSLTLPFYALTPVIVVIGEMIFFRTTPSLVVLLGIALIVLGGYLLNVSKSKTHLLAPLRAIYQNKGSLLALCSAFLFAITAVCDKFLIGIVDQHAYVAWAIIGNFFWLTLYLVMTGDLMKKPREMFSHAYRMLCMAVLLFFSLVFTLIAYDLSSASVVVSVKRSTAIWGILFGYFFFRERQMLPRLEGAVMMISGVALVVLYGT